MRPGPSPGRSCRSRGWFRAQILIPSSAHTFEPRNANRTLHPRRRFLETEFERVLEIVAPPRPLSSGTAATAEYVQTEEVSEDVAKIAEGPGIKAGKALAAEPLVTEAVVTGTLVAVRENRVGLGGLLELLLGLRQDRGSDPDGISPQADGRQS